MLRTVRITLAVISFILVTLLFLDFTGTLHAYFGWLAKIQFIPALFALNVGVVLALVVVTLLCGRIYCSIVCPLGIMQDIFGAFTKKRRSRHRFHYTPARHVLRYTVLALFIIAFIAGIGPFVALISPYSAYGRIASNLLAPLYQWGNNLLAHLAERADSYLFYETDVWLKSLPTFIIAVVTLVVIAVLALRGGRTYCNTICPVGTVLGFLSRFSLLKPVIDTSKCNGCKACARKCKAVCINPEAHEIDYSRCVACMDCLNDCRQGAISYTIRKKSVKHAEPATSTAKPATATAAPASTPVPTATNKPADAARRSFLTLSAAVAATAALKAQEDALEGGLATIEEKKIPKRATPITPPGSVSARSFSRHCTACQLCVSVCPNQVLRPSTDISRLMQPEMSYERGYCRPECTRCSEVCPTGAIRKIDRAEKSSIQIGHAVWIKDNCVCLTDNVPCGNCARHCPTGAIQMVPLNPDQEPSIRIPAVNTERCIGCGACENLCPARPFSAIYVEGHEAHRTV